MAEKQLIQHILFLFVLLLLSLMKPCGAYNFRTTNGTIRCIEKERMALLQTLANCTQLSSIPDDCCSWSGVYCSNLTNRVYMLDIDQLYSSYFEIFNLDFHLDPSLLALEDLLYLKLTIDLEVIYQESLGQDFPIPAFIGSFSKLRSLTLSGFTGAIPPQLGNLTNLQSLEMHHLDIDNVEWLSHLTSLKHLVLQGVYLPEAKDLIHSIDNLEWLSRLTSLKHFVLGGVDLSGAKDLIHAINSLPSLTHLDLRDSNVPTFLSSHVASINSSKSLAFVDLSYTQLKSSSIWTWLFNHSSSLVELYLSDNELTGQIPYDLRNMTSLQHLDLSSNQLKGMFQLSIQGLCRLQTLDLSRNGLMGDLSSVFNSLSCAENSLAVLALQRNDLSGSFPDITKFSALRKLLLQRNNLNGTLAPSFGELSNLVILNLQQNYLTGSIPDLSGFRSLKILKLRNNQLNGSVHLNLGLLSSLEILDISLNSLKGYICATHFLNLSSLWYLDLSFNSLTFNISSDWVPPFRLRTIGLALCKLGSRFPQWLQTQKGYSSLDMSNAGISDNLPFWFWNISSLATFIGLSHNNLYGPIPNLSSVFSLNPAIDLSSNLLEGEIPSFFSNVVYLNLSRNSFSGSIFFLCQNVSDYGAMLGLDLSHNNLSGKFPRCWTNNNIRVLDLSSNNFFGNIPSSFGSLSSLAILHLRDNFFSGKLPLFMTNFIDLVTLDLGDNLFDGEIPTRIGQMRPRLTVLSLRNNRFSGRIPLQICNLSYIQILDLSMNNISKVIPHCLCDLISMTQIKIHPMLTFDGNGTFASISGAYQDYITLALKGFTYEFTKHLELVKSIDLSGNRLEGKLPAEISCLSGLVSLNLSRNNLTGYITPKIGQLKSLESLDLSENHLSGQIPATISELNFLGTLSLANNNLSGRIPSGTQIQGFNASVFAGNPRLCGDPLPKKCIGDEVHNYNDQNPQNLEHEDGVVSLGLYISTVLGLITGFWVVCGALVLNNSLRYGYFRFLDRLYARIHATIALKMAVIRRQSQA